MRYGRDPSAPETTTGGLASREPGSVQIALVCECRPVRSAWEGTVIRWKCGPRIPATSRAVLTTYGVVVSNGAMLATMRREWRGQPKDGVDIVARRDRRRSPSSGAYGSGPGEDAGECPRIGRDVVADKLSHLDQKSDWCSKRT